ncbi:hypothetical protein GCM10010390_15380 [Streptomyces mordarskii]|uniref:Uncharacterized protein n=1 Tax=Streptomyces mordarskii TaxID=1226758 RepID=A0ABN1C8I8_9ACTN
MGYLPTGVAPPRTLAGHGLREQLCSVWLRMELDGATGSQSLKLGYKRRVATPLGVKGSQVQILSSRPAFSQVEGRFRG